MIDYSWIVCLALDKQFQERETGYNHFLTQAPHPTPVKGHSWLCPWQTPQFLPLGKLSLTVYTNKQFYLLGSDPVSFCPLSLYAASEIYHEITITIDDRKWRFSGLEGVSTLQVKYGDAV